MNILQIHSSARTVGSHSSHLAGEIVNRLLVRYPSANVVLRDLCKSPHPELSEASLQAMFTPPDQRLPEQAARVALDDVLIAELQAADIVVLGVPMYNFCVPAALKNWIDAIVRVGVTFSYNDHGSFGLLHGKRAYVALARGGVYRDTPEDTQVPTLKKLLGFLGITDVHFVYAEGMVRSSEAVETGIGSAIAQIAELTL